MFIYWGFHRQNTDDVGTFMSVSINGLKNAPLPWISEQSCATYLMLSEHIMYQDSNVSKLLGLNLFTHFWPWLFHPLSRSVICDPLSGLFLVSWNVAMVTWDGWRLCTTLDLQPDKHNCGVAHDTEKTWHTAGGHYQVLLPQAKNRLSSFQGAPFIAHTRVLL